MSDWCDKKVDTRKKYIFVTPRYGWWGIFETVTRSGNCAMFSCKNGNRVRLLYKQAIYGNRAGHFLFKYLAIPWAIVISYFISCKGDGGLQKLGIELIVINMERTESRFNDIVLWGFTGLIYCRASENLFNSYNTLSVQILLESNKIISQFSRLREYGENKFYFWSHFIIFSVGIGCFLKIYLLSVLNIRNGLECDIKIKCERDNILTANKDSKASLVSEHVHGFETSCSTAKSTVALARR